MNLAPLGHEYQSGEESDAHALRPVHEICGRDQPWLTPEDVHNQVFTTVRLREGYDLGEIDGFLGRVEGTLTALYRDNATLRADLETAARAAERAAVRGGGAERIVALAQKVADEAVAEAFEKAEQIVKEAETRAASVERRARDQVAGIQREVSHLSEFAAHFRGRLQTSLRTQMQAVEEQLNRLDAAIDPTPPATATGTGRYETPVTMLHQDGPDNWRVGAQRDGHLTDEHRA
ncbi:DivIVA domain-containing protein [Streptomyces sp. FIT100]|uniref:DivIVA domain-containing protein n=1 Tax=Streptomyces sp. FIT100 TaxID=2837956 RepID=UPI0021C6273E|nr:DivIVA domain-containing protein [Streptomyces sp. FIT100]UUN30027.1 DivIVA domain-containing protein [Streptomyces sp. FIT100]